MWGLVGGDVGQFILFRTGQRVDDIDDRSMVRKLGADGLLGECEEGDGEKGEERENPKRVLMKDNKAQQIQTHTVRFKAHQLDRQKPLIKK